MPSTFTTSLRLELQAPGENRSTWGTKANNVFSRIEDAIAGVASIDMDDDDYTLTIANGDTDEARNAVLILSSVNTAARTLTIPTVEKTYFIINQTGKTVTVSNGTNTVDIADDDGRFIITDGTDIYATHNALADIGTAALVDTGTSGAKVPLLNGANTWSANQTISGNLTVSGTISGTFSGSGASITSLNASKLSSGTVPDARVSGTYTGFASITGTGTATFSAFSGNGTSLTNLNASNVSSGTLAAARLPTQAVQWSDVSQNNVGSRIVQRDASGDISTRLLRSEYTSTSGTVNYIMTQQAVGTNNNYVRPSTPGQVADALKNEFPSLSVTGSITTGGMMTFDSYCGSSDSVAIFYADSGTIYWRPVSYASSSGQAYLTSAGTFVASGDIIAFSDARVKKNIVSISDAVSKVLGIGGYTFDRTDIETKRQTGVIAQEVAKVLPEAVHEGADGTLSVAYGNMVGLLVEAIKELKGEVEALKARLE